MISRKVLGLLGLGLVACGCGGGVAAPSSSSASSSSGGSSTSSSSSGGAQGCTELGCANGAEVVFSFSGVGAYVVVAVIDGVTTTCKASIPLPREPGTVCDRPGVLLTLSGSMLPVDQQSIGGLHLQDVTAKSLAVKVSRDGQLLGSTEVASIPWVTSPGPNGPGCEPAQCTQAKVPLSTR